MDEEMNIQKRKIVFLISYLYIPWYIEPMFYVGCTDKTCETYVGTYNMSIYKYVARSIVNDGSGFKILHL